MGERLFARRARARRRVLLPNTVARQSAGGVTSMGKDFAMRAKISKKESKESRFWLTLTQPTEAQQGERDALAQEATELMKIPRRDIGENKVG